MFLLVHGMLTVILWYLAGKNWDGGSKKLCSYSSALVGLMGILGPGELLTGMSIHVEYACCLLHVGLTVSVRLLIWQLRSPHA